MKERLASGRLPLNEAERRRDLATTKQLDHEIAHDVRAATADRTTYVITVKNAPHAGLPAPGAATAARHRSDGKSDRARSSRD